VHIEALLGHFETFAAQMHDPSRVLWALYWHDAIYDPMRGDNEALSADLLRAEGAGVLPDAALEEAAVIIEATAKHQLPERLEGGALSDAALFLDMDLSILGAREAVFDVYEDNIRHEYSFVPEEVYRTARANILKGFLGRDKLYFTDDCGALWEAPARANLARSIARLSA
jgi:predicted metal-dependent HD superfamily phosphohydrolase